MPAGPDDGDAAGDAEALASRSLLHIGGSVNAAVLPVPVDIAAISPDEHAAPPREAPRP
jgi:hypothetical protein